MAWNIGTTGKSVSDSLTPSVSAMHVMSVCSVHDLWL